MEKNKQQERRSPNGLMRDGDQRTPFERDMARLIHSAAFRRLQAKTQVLGIGEGDFHRTRLTHSMEVAQIGKGLLGNLKEKEHSEEVRNALPDPDNIFCIGLAHDIGHPPFGHGGEIALNYAMESYGGFEGNGQTLRILSRLEAHSSGYGLDLTRRTLLGVLKYPVKYSLLRRKRLEKYVSIERLKAEDWKPPKCYLDEEEDVVEWILSPLASDDQERFVNYNKPTKNKNGKPTVKSLDTTIMELADDIAYGIHDLEDATALKLITLEMWREAIERIDSNWIKEHHLESNVDLFGESSKRKRAIGALVHALIVNASIDKRDYESDLLKYCVGLPKEAHEAMSIIKELVKKHVIKIPEVQTLEYRGQQIVATLFEAIASDPEHFLKTSFREEWEKADNDNGKMRVVCDFVSGMTDEYATRMYERLFMPRHGTVFQRL